MKRGAWIVREAVPEDDPQIADLFDGVFGFRPSASHIDWKFRQNPDAIPLTVVAECENTIVGQYALWSTRLRLGREVVIGAQSLDTMTHPDFRGQGMFVALATECMELAFQRGVEALYGFPNDNSYPGFVRRLDWDHTGDVAGWVRPLVPSRHKRVPKMAEALRPLSHGLQHRRPDLG
jgi:predicted N-acetyltransferase YhbS